MSVSNLFVLGNALSVLSNVAYMEESTLVSEAGTSELLMKLLCNELLSPPPEVTCFAVQTLSNMVADPNGVAAFTQEERARLSACLDEISLSADSRLQVS